MSAVETGGTKKRSFHHNKNNGEQDLTNKLNGANLRFIDLKSNKKKLEHLPVIPLISVFEMFL